MKAQFSLLTPQKHFPTAVKMFGADYYAPLIAKDKIPSIQPVPENSTIEKKYKVKILAEDELKSSYDLVVIVWPINSLGTWLDARLNCMTPTTMSYKTDIDDRRELFDKIYSIIDRISPKKIVYFDGSDSPGVSNRKYHEESCKLDNVIFGGRLAEYRYYDMHQVVSSALSKSLRELKK